jgi:hypothetical protein
MATVTTTYFFMTDDRATDRTQAPGWRRPQESSSTLAAWKWTAAPRG